MQIRYRVWIDGLVLLALLSIAAGSVLWHMRIAGQSQKRDAEALRLVTLANELNAMAYDQHQLGVNWPGDQWRRKLGELDEALSQPTVRGLDNTALIQDLDRDGRDLRRVVERVASGESDGGLVNTLFKLTSMLVGDSLRLVDAGNRRLVNLEWKLNAMTVGGVGLLGLAWVLGSFLFDRSISRSLARLGVAAGALARDGVDCRLEERGPGEVIALARAVNAMCDAQRQSLQSMDHQLAGRDREAARREAALAEVDAERALYLEIINLTPMGLAIFEGPELRLRWANTALSDILESPDQARAPRGLRLEELTFRIERIRRSEIFERVRASGQPYFSPVETERAGPASGETFWQWKIFPLGAGGALPGLLLVLVNVTGQTRDRKRLEELATRLERMNQAKDSFMALLGHELRNPLAPIQNALYGLRQRGFENELQRNSLSIIERQVRHMSRLVDDLLDVSRISRGKIELRRARVELGKIVQQAVESTGGLIQNRDHALTVQLPEAPILLDADPARLEQILVNLLNNAAKYTEPGGRIWLTVERAGDQVAVRVRDTGVGIAPEMLPRLFEPFSQVDRSLELSQGGLGLGLALVRSLAQLHGGDVEVRSEGVGHGSEFIVRLPALPEGTRPSPRPPGVGDDGASRGLRILVAEDNSDTSGSMVELLAMWGHEAVVAGDGPSALALALDYQPDVVLLDIGLPGMDGYQVARKLRELSGLSSIPIVAISGFGQSDDLDRSRQSGIQHHLTKPIELERLRELLASYARDFSPGTRG